ncbi:hypothetical protein CQW23_16585 [Capsicum baccatum]|uniref:Uncharacterized protein n=1 Tax=Capsicum baccatum TaxID=33114 RepID=A0A2G2WBS3_CAPBA|nr:hypothetical protein CQW23_16585 [Capsicum baccatum]
MRCESSWRIPPSLSISRIKRKGDKGELKNLGNIVAEAKTKDVKVVSAVVKRMLDKNMFLFGFVDVNESSAAERLDELTGVQNASIQIACKKLFADTRIGHFTHMDMGSELEVDLLKQKSTEYARAKELAIKVEVDNFFTCFHVSVLKGASDTVDIENIKHITQNQTLIGDLVGKTADDWKAQKELFYQKTGIRHQPVIVSQQDAQEEKEKFFQQDVAEEQDDNEDFSKELEEVLLSAQNDSDIEE